MPLGPGPEAVATSKQGVRILPEMAERLDGDAGSADLGRAAPIVGY